MFPRKSKAADPHRSWWLRNGSILTPAGIHKADLLIVGDRIAQITAAGPSDDREAIDLHGLLVTPGLVDAEHDLAADAQTPTLPGPYLDRARRNEQRPETSADNGAIAAAADRLTKEGVTAVAGPTAPPTENGPRHIDGPRIASLVLDRNPAKTLARAKGLPVFVSAGDGDSRAAARDFTLLVEMGLLAQNLVVIGGTALRRDDAQKLADAGATLVWRPITDEFVLGRTIDADVTGLTDLRLLIGAGARRDGGEGLLAALKRADALRLINRARLLRAVTTAAAEAFGLECGVITEGWLADMAVWDAPDLETAVFEKGAEALRLTIIGGRIVHQSEKCFT